MKYKVGDRVRIKSLDWYNKNKSKRGNISFPYEAEIVFTSEMSSFCGQIVTISQKGYTQDVWFYRIKEDRGSYMWTDEMIECKVEEETCTSLNIYKDGYIHGGNVVGNEITLPEGYIFKDENGNVINATKIVLEKGNKYPKTYEECCKVLQYGEILKIYPPSNADVPEYDVLGLFDSLEALRKLLICRDAYWKIAGEEMGLGKPWEPDYTNRGEKKFSIWVDFGEIKLGGAFTTTQMVLSFPTAEMRDGFKKNFDPDIEFCKELL